MSDGGTRLKIADKPTHKWYAAPMERVGENIQREWDADSRATEIWDALELCDEDPKDGLSKLAAIAEGGSALAMMYLGVDYSRRGKEGEAERWLRQSANAGSIEGGIQLAAHFQRSGKGQEAAEEYRRVLPTGYAPAMFYLGTMLFYGRAVEKDVTTSLEYFELAKRAGHLPSMAYLAKIYGKGGFGLRGRIAAHWNCFAKIPLMIWYLRNYPKSDRMRGLRLPSQKKGVPA